MTLLLNSDNFRILEIDYTSYNIDNLKGDCYSTECNPDIDPKELRAQELKFEAQVESEGVYGYILERYTKGEWAQIDSCWGFVGKYNGTNQHYLIEEMKETAQATFTQFNFNSDREFLTDGDRDQIYELLSKGLRHDNRNLMYRRIFEHYNMVPYHGILGRIIKETHKDGTTYWQYFAGQSYTEEMRRVRKIILTCK